MVISKYRRMLNDSRLGQWVNNSIPGILVEGTSRTLTDTVDSLGSYLLGTAAMAAAVVTAPAHDIRSRLLATIGAFCYLTAHIHPDSVSFDGAYSHESPLFERTTMDDGTVVMQRVPMMLPLVERVAKYSKTAALDLVFPCASHRPETNYRR